jgi:glutaredoxin
MDRDVRVYGADSCMDTSRTREHLQDLGIDHRYISVDEDTIAEHRVRDLNGGKLRTPTVLLQGRQGDEQLVTPSEAELDAALVRQGFLAARHTRVQ